MICFQLQGPSSPLAAQLGGSVLLPCAAESPLPLEELEVEWRRANSGALLHLFQEGEERPESQDQAYRGRVDFFRVDMAKGNFSILLKNVSQADPGVYSCKVSTKNEAHNITVELSRFGLSSLQSLVLVFCAASFVISIVAFVHFMTRGINGGVFTVHIFLMFSPHVLLFIAFIIWGSVGGLLSEAATCSVVNLTRILLLLLTSPYLGEFFDSIQKLIRNLSVSLAHTIIAVVVYSDAYHKRTIWMSQGLLSGTHIHKLRLRFSFTATLFLNLCGIATDIVSAYKMPCMKSRPNSGEPSEHIWTFFVLEMSSVTQIVFLTLRTKAYSHEVRSGLIWLPPAMPVIVMLIRRLVKKQKPCCKPYWGRT
ncbi:uncharacterized protein LOC134439280 [Engraulis encrasicolus]|uniref:uncharacterized protein LOC134439280 n=1 Tax=Engraulis encrasicolus TaxID=184585 RepID=UPI002FD0DACD